MSLVICSYHEPAESIPHPSVLLPLIYFLITTIQK